MNKFLFVMLSSSLLMMSCSPTNKTSSASQQRTADSPKPTAKQLETVIQGSSPTDKTPMPIPPTINNLNHSSNDTTIPTLIVEERITSHAQDSTEPITNTPKVTMRSITGSDALELQSLYFKYDSISQILVHLDKDIQYIRDHGQEKKYPKAKIEIEIARKIQDKEKWISDLAEIKRQIDELNAKSLYNQG